MISYNVVERFISINGEGRLAGELAIFIRFKGCNLKCSYCDTSWANEDSTIYEILSVEDICDYVISTKIKNVTLTGGEPLLQKNIIVLIKALLEIEDINIEIETNGSIDLLKYKLDSKRLFFTMDYKLSGSLMEKYMCLDNFNILTERDSIKFVISNVNELDVLRNIIEKFSLIKKCNIFLSPVYGKIEPDKIVEYMKLHEMNYIKLQLQLHKVIWDSDRRGV